MENVGLVWFAVTGLEAMLCISSLSVLFFSIHARRREVFNRSYVLPFLKKMEKDLEHKEDDPVFISKFKSELWSDLEKRCLENLNQRLLAKAAFFDKRFSNLKFLEEEEKKAVLD